MRRLSPARVVCSHLPAMPTDQRLKHKLCAINLISFGTGVTRGAARAGMQLSNGCSGERAPKFLKPNRPSPAADVPPGCSQPSRGAGESGGATRAGWLYHLPSTHLGWQLFGKRFSSPSHRLSLVSLPQPFFLTCFTRSISLFFCLFFPFLNYRHFEKSSEVPLLLLLPSTPPQCEQHRGSRMRRSCSRQSRPRTRRARLYFKHLIKLVFGAAPSLCPSAEPSHLPRAETGVLSARRRAPGPATGPPARTKGLQAPGGA